MVTGLLHVRPSSVDRCTHDVFVTSRGFKRLTFPRYALLDHVPFDDALRRQFGGTCIEDAWRPFFAVATVLDGTHLNAKGSAIVGPIVAQELAKVVPIFAPYLKSPATTEPSH